MKENTVRIAHISDMHCYRLTLNPFQFLSKRWIGNFNALFNRRLHFYKDPNAGLVPLFRDWNTDHVMISGDLTTTGLSSEFAVAGQFVDELRRQGMEVHLVPGNHDSYTSCTHRRGTFYRFFENQPLSNHWISQQFIMKEDKVGVRPLGKGWWFVGIDTAIPTPLFCSKGHFSSELERRLEEALKAIPEGESIVLVNHFPMFPTIHPSHDMERADALRALLLRYPQVKLYLHGHVHKQAIVDPRASGLPLILNSGSCGFRRRATCHLIELADTYCKVMAYSHEGDTIEGRNWSLQQEETFNWHK